MPASEHHLRARCRRPPAYPPPPTRSLSRASRPKSPAPSLGFRAEPALRYSARPFRPPCGLAAGPAESRPLSRTHLFSHGRGSFPPLATGLGRKQTAQLVLTESSSIHRRLLLLPHAILRCSGGNAGSWQPPRPPLPPPPGLHLLGPALPVVASGPLDRLGLQKTTIPEVLCAPGHASRPSDGGRCTCGRRGASWEA